MGLATWYDAQIVPRLIRCACASPAIMALRGMVVPQASGAVFELGCGGGINLGLIDPAGIASYAGLDPSARGLDYARAVAAGRGLAADLRHGCGEAIPFADAAFDTVICTFTLCSVADPARTAAELHRVLKPGGRLLYAEHGAAPDPGIATWQRRIEPVWKRIAGGCHLTRPISAPLLAAGFVTEPVHAGYAPRTPRIAGWMEAGIARKPGA